MEEGKEQQQEILTAINELRVEMRDIKNVLIGTTHDDKPGVLERLRRLEAWQESEKKFAWIIGAIILGDIVMRVWGVITAVTP